MTSSSWYRRNFWQFKGNREYTKAGYEAAKLRFEESNLDVDCSDRHFIITGANSGLGLESAVEIARRGGILHLVCRNTKSMKEARSHIITTTGNDRIYQHEVNLLRPKDVARWSEEFLKTHDRLDVLINNAGCLVHERTVDEDGNETHFAVHILAVHIITTTLLPLLQRSQDPRVVTVSSAGMLKVRLDLRDLSFEKMKPFDGRLAYLQTKRQQVVLNFCYAQRYAGVRFYSMHPGWVDTPSVRNSLPDFYKTMKDCLRTPLQGADTIIWLSISEAALRHPSGLFFQDRTPVATHLPMAWTRHTGAEEHEFMTRLDNLLGRYSTRGLVSVQRSLPETSTGQHLGKDTAVLEDAQVQENSGQENSYSSQEEVNKESKAQIDEGEADERSHNTKAVEDTSAIAAEKCAEVQKVDVENLDNLEKKKERIRAEGDQTNVTAKNETGVGDLSGQSSSTASVLQSPEENAPSVLDVALDKRLTEVET